ncbi:MoaB/Mog domain-containing protein [Scheffersomyces amazonensis]|uniref:MoaB/Mog domain-containing protein n=1 Tax=Scheffersomyces amazonensis TaxID=1078765 RepID=UPI00315DC30C
MTASLSSGVTPITKNYQNYQNYPISPIISSAGCLIIGDEVLNGKILDTNSFQFAKFCFNDLSIPLKRTIVCGDDKQDIFRSLKFLLEEDKVDFIVSSGGLGSTHDDITYQVISEYYNLDYELDNEVVERMQSIRHEYLDKLSNDQLQAFYKMATLPKTSNGINVEKIFTDESLWFPIIVIDYKLYILPGIPQLFERLIKSLQPILLPRIPNQDKSLLKRYYIKTSSSESELAPYLTQLQINLDKKYGNGIIKLGSYPHMAWKLNTISIITTNNELTKDDLNKTILNDIIENIGGNAQLIDQIEEDKLTNELPETINKL